MPSIVPIDNNGKPISGALVPYSGSKAVVPYRPKKYGGGGVVPYSKKSTGGSLVNSLLPTASTALIASGNPYAAAVGYGLQIGNGVYQVGKKVYEWGKNNGIWTWLKNKLRKRKNKPAPLPLPPPAPKPTSNNAVVVVPSKPSTAVVPAPPPPMPSPMRPQPSPSSMATVYPTMRNKSHYMPSLVPANSLYSREFRNRGGGGTNLLSFYGFQRPRSKPFNHKIF